MLMEIGVGRHQRRFAIHQPTVAREHPALVDPQTVLLMFKDKTVRAGCHHAAALAGVNSRIPRPKADQPIPWEMKCGGLRGFAIVSNWTSNRLISECSSHPFTWKDGYLIRNGCLDSLLLPEDRLGRPGHHFQFAREPHF